MGWWAVSTVLIVLIAALVGGGYAFYLWFLFDWCMRPEVRARARRRRTDYLRDEGVPFVEMAGGAVGGLGGLTEDERVRVCRAAFGVDLSAEKAAKS